MRKEAPDFPDEVRPGAFAQVLTEVMPRLALPEEARPHVPEVVAAFLDYLDETGQARRGGRLGGAGAHHRPSRTASD